LRAFQQSEIKRQYRETIIRHTDGTLLTLQANALPLDKRLLTGLLAQKHEQASLDTVEPVALVVHQDVTERMELERRKDEFIAMASHELKTPVTSIKIYEQLLHRRLTKQGDSQSAEMLEKIDVQLGTLTRLINELLDVTHMATGILSWQAEPFDLTFLVNETVADLRHGTEHHQIHIEGVGPVQIYADRERIGQVLANLLTNAIKYTPKGGSIVVKQALDNDYVIISVQDCGIGIPPEKQAYVFERFYRVRSPEHETFPGLGLGLYLSAEIVKRQGGKIWVESQPGTGSTFYFTLRLGIPESNPEVTV
jgi:signal transduction histidine kinase